MCSDWKPETKDKLELEKWSCHSRWCMEKCETYFLKKDFLPVLILAYFLFLGSNAEGSTLNITQINREHMGTYVCEANNGITPKAYQEFNVQVNCKQNSCLGIFA